MKKLLTFMLGICLIIPCAFMFSACKDNNKMETWDGTVLDVSEAVNGVVTIETAEELAGFAKEVNEGNNFEGITVKLACDMNLANKEWTPIGFGGSDIYGNVDSYGATFNGTFDGQDHTIYNLKITTFKGGSLNAEAATGVGLFGAINNATVKNFDIENATVEGNHYVAAVVGQARGSIIEDIDVENAAISCVYLDEDESGDKAGVIVGYIGNLVLVDSLVKDCSAEDSTVNAARDAGQIIGCLAIDIVYANPQTLSTQVDNEASRVVVTDNNSTQNTSNNDNIKNEIVGRLHDAR